MPPKPGEKLAHYEIVEPIGKGGMGEVFRARDAKLGRDVAIKVLPQEFAQDEERLRRFQREAKVLASLNHPNIAAIYGLEHSNDTHYLVLELVPGETLAERIARGAISVEETLEIATKIADALEEAHEQGIVHRDLKPANVKLTEDDKVKVLDFGLAKAFFEESPDADSSMSPTITRDATRIGVILGTAAYMSPEQAKGKRVDKRADVWAFGAVVYEMLTGKRAFSGEDVSDTLAAVLRAEVDFDALPRGASPAMRTALARCLAKDPRQRARDIGDVKLAMQGGFESTRPEPSGTRPSHRWRQVAMAGLLSGVAVWAWMRRPPPPPSVARFVVTAEPSPSPFVGGNPSGLMALSPDGSMLVYRSGAGSGGNQLYQRRLDQLEGNVIEGTETTTTPFFSPDGAWLGFSAAPELKKVPAAGGTPVTVAKLQSGIRGASWGSDGSIVFGYTFTRALHRVSADGGEPEVLLHPDSIPTVGEGASFWWPEILPGSEAVLFTITQAAGSSRQIAALNLETSEVTSLVSPGTHPRYVPTGHIVYGGGDSTLRAVPFDVDRLEVTGPSKVVLDGVLTLFSGATAFDIAANGSLAYTTGTAYTEARLVWVDRSGREELVETAPMTFDHPRLSPDGRRVAVEVEGNGNEDIRVVDLERGTIVTLTRRPETDTSPVWSRDGSSIVFGSFGDGGGIFKIASDGTGAVEHLAGSVTGSIPLPLAWSPDDEIVFYESGGPTIGNIYRLVLESGRVEPVLDSPELQEAHPSLSPDGRLLAYTGNESGASEIYVRPYPNVDDGRTLVSPAGGNEPLFSPDGSELFYWDDATRSMMVVPVTLEPQFGVGVATKLFEGDYLFPAAGRHYDVSSDGQRFLMVKPGTGYADTLVPETQIVLVQNWFQELKRLVPNED